MESFKKLQPALSDGLGALCFLPGPFHALLHIMCSSLLMAEAIPLQLFMMASLPRLHLSGRFLVIYIVSNILDPAVWQKRINLQRLLARLPFSATCPICNIVQLLSVVFHAGWFFFVRIVGHFRLVEANLQTVWIWTERKCLCNKKVFNYGKYLFLVAWASGVIWARAIGFSKIENWHCLCSCHRK